MGNGDGGNHVTCEVPPDTQFEGDRLRWHSPGCGGGGGGGDGASFVPTGADVHESVGGDASLLATAIASSNA